MATEFNVRVGDADREAVASQLREHYSDGRLTLDELNERLDQTFAAKTRADLNTVTRDLPPIAGRTAGTPGDASGLSAGNGPSPWTGPRWNGAGWGGDSRWEGRGGGTGGTGPHRRGLLAGAAVMVPAFIAMWVLLVLGGLFVFGLGGPRPLGIVFLLAALAVLRRLFGRRRRYVRRGPCGRRW
jgi:Domain of unknown function (DUF1707)